MAHQSESVKLQQATVRGEQKIVNVELEAVCISQTTFIKLQSQSGELSPHLVRSVLGVGDFHPMPSTNAQLKISYAIAVVNGGCQIPSTDISTVSKQSGTGFVGILDAGGEKTLVCHSSASGHKCALQNRHWDRGYSYSRASV